MRICETKRRCLFPLAIIVMAAICCGGKDRNLVQRPPGSGYHAMAYDTESRRAILFGGQTGDISNHPEIFLSAETWAYDPARNFWRKMAPKLSPPPMAAQAMAYDSESDRVILHGGGGVFDKEKMGDAVLEQTWAYDFNANTWTKMSDGPPRLGHRMAYDRESDRIIVFSGFCFLDGEFRAVQETWAYDFNSDTWTEMKPAQSPAARIYCGMAYETESDRVILWGGFISKEIQDSSIWTYDLNTNTWSELIPESGPQPRSYLAMAYDEHASRIVLFGGMDDGNAETWAYDHNGNTWAELHSDGTPGRLSRMPMVYIPEARRVVLFGGQLDSRQYAYSDATWLYDLKTNAWTDVTVRRGEYFGQRKPGLVPEVFAPGIVSTFYLEHSAVAFSSDGMEAYWTSDFRDYGLTEGRIFYARQKMASGLLRGLLRFRMI